MLGFIIITFSIVVLATVIFISVATTKSPFSANTLGTKYTVGNIIHDMPPDFRTERTACILHPDVRLQLPLGLHSGQTSQWES